MKVIAALAAVAGFLLMLGTTLFAAPVWFQLFMWGVSLVVGAELVARRGDRRPASRPAVPAETGQAGEPETTMEVRPRLPSDPI